MVLSTMDFSFSWMNFGEFQLDFPVEHYLSWEMGFRQEDQPRELAARLVEKKNTSLYRFASFLAYVYFINSFITKDPKVVTIRDDETIFELGL